MVIPGDDKPKTHDTHAAPPQAIWDKYKEYQKKETSTLDHDLDILDFTRGLTNIQKQKIKPINVLPSRLILEAVQDFKNASNYNYGKYEVPESLGKTCIVYGHEDFEGLKLIPSLIPPESQIMILDSILHRDLANPFHKNNLQSDYEIPYPSWSSSCHIKSFFDYPRVSKTEVYKPLNIDSNCKPLNTSQFLGKKLRWLTLGLQYNWKTRSYLPQSQTPFPQDIAALVRKLFSSAFEPESGVVLLYGLKDYSKCTSIVTCQSLLTFTKISGPVPVHRDVSEECQRGLASFSFGCDGLFIITKDKEGYDPTDLNRDMVMEVIRVKSGDCIWMEGETRWCWHAMPKIIGGTSPSWLNSWPALGDKNEKYREWKSFMSNRRLNLSCRQVFS